MYQKKQSSNLPFIFITTVYAAQSRCAIKISANFCAENMHISVKWMCNIFLISILKLYK